MNERSKLKSITTDLVIEAFRKTEQKQYQLELAQYQLSKRLNGTIDMDHYFTETEKVREKYEKDREFAQMRGLLPREA